MNFNSIKKASVIGIFMMLTILIAIAFYGVYQLEKLSETRQRLKRTNEIIVDLHSIFSAVKDAETGQRGFLITEDSRYLDTYQDALLVTPGFIKELRQLTVNSPSLTRDINDLESSISKKYAELAVTLELRKTKGFEAARAVVLTNRGKNEMDNIRYTFANTFKREADRLREREKSEHQQARWVFFCLLFLCSAAVIFQITMSLMTLRFLEREKLVTDKLREQASLLDLSLDAIVVRDVDGKIEYWNLGAEKMYGFTKEEAIGQFARTLLKTEFPRSLAKIESSLLNHGYWEGELSHLKKNGDRIVVLSRQVSKIDRQGNSVGLLETTTDITLHKEFEQKQMALMEMKRVNVELEHFTSMVSHDLQEPLRAITGCLQILERSHKDKLNKEASELMQFAVDGATRMRKLISDLLSLSQVSRCEAALERVDLTEILDEAKKNIEASLTESKAIITHDPLPVLKAERTLLVQLFQNLLSNAIKFCKDKPPEIHISANKKGGLWQICVKDNGIGFEQEYADRIFEPFKRLHNEEEYQGTGIGLAICKKIVERHAGNVWAESQSGKGATFCFTLTDFDQDA